MATIERLRIYPVKGFDGIELETSTVTPGGTVVGDREFALFDTDGEVMNGKRTACIHDLSTEYNPATGELAVETPAGEYREFALRDEDERARASTWFSDFFDVELSLERDKELGFVDRREMGPSVISTATLEEVASWFEEMTVHGARRRLRANVEVSGVPAFWEDRFVGEEAPAFDVDGVRFEGVTPCGRCVVPERHPDTGEPIGEFKETFLEKREETFPEWADWEAFDHYFTVMLIASIPEQFRDGKLAVGDAVTVTE